VSEAWLFLSPSELQNNPVCLDRETVQHIRALRLREDDLLFLSDGRGRAWRARLEGTAAQGIQAFLLEELVRHNEPPLHVTLLAAVTKGEKMDQMVRGAVELGVKEIIPVLTSRTVVQLPPAKRAEKAARWQKIAMAAASVCRRSYLPRIHHPLDFSELPALLAAKELVIVPWEGERERGLLALLKSIAVPPRELLIFTGPEGGISGAEMAKLKELAPVYPVSLGPRILSAQTAPLAVLSVIMALWGDLG
jgi:16S rRNA (uracil1498-N3)-methyltransferase